MQDLQSFTFPQEIAWGPAVAGWRWLVFAYDWDVVTLSDNVTVRASNALNLCTANFPCALKLWGGVYSEMELFGDVQLACLSSAGCSSIYIHSVVFKCISTNRSALKIEGSLLGMFNASFVGCSANTDGGVIQAYALAEVVIESCNFTNVFSGGFGGAVASYGSSLYISNSVLHNCTSLRGGGAVWSSAFQGCYGSDVTNNTYLHIWSSVFSQCSTGSACALASSIDEILNSLVRWCWRRCLGRISLVDWRR